jgi:hypothetical protein
MDRACSTNGANQDCIQVIGGKDIRIETTTKTKI